MKKNIKLIAIDVSFNRHSIIYKVKTEGSLINKGLVVSEEDIKNKDLLLKSSFLSESMEVSFTTVIATPNHYKKVIKLHSRYIKDIYSVGDVVGYLIPLNYMHLC